MVARQVGTEGVAGGELRGGEGFGWIWGPVLWWFPDAAEGLGGSARSRGGGWWCYTRGGALVATEWTGERRRLHWSEMGKKTFLGRLRARGAPEGLLEVA